MVDDWHVVHVRLRKMGVAIEALRNRGYDPYVPKLRELRPVPKEKLKLADRNKARRPVEAVLRPLFNGYVFVRMSLQSDWHKLFDFYGVYGLVVDGNRPARVATSVIDRLRAEEIDNAIPVEARLPELALKLGMVLRICDGPLKDFEGTIGELDETRCRVFLNMLMFGRESPVELSFDQVELVEPRPRQFLSTSQTK